MSIVSRCKAKSFTLLSKVTPEIVKKIVNKKLIKFNHERHIWGPLYIFFLRHSDLTNNLMELWYKIYVYEFFGEGQVSRSVPLIHYGKKKKSDFDQYVFLNKEVFFSVMDKYLNQSPDIVIDLGSGWGRMTLALHDRFPNQKYLSGELAQSGRNVLQGFIKKFNLHNISSFEFDFYDYFNLIEIIKRNNYKNIVIFTHSSIVQIPVLGDKLFIDLLNLGLRSLSVIHFEPVLWQVNGSTPICKNYNSDLYETLSLLELQDKITILSKGKYGFGHGHNTASENAFVIEWEPKYNA